MDVITPKDWEELGRQYRSAKPFPSICIDNFLEPEFAEALIASYPEYDAAKKIGKEFKAVNENKKIQITELDKFPEPVRILSAALESPQHIRNMETLTGINHLIWDPSFRGGGMHLTNSSGLLDVHIDFNYEGQLELYRRVNILIYLNKDWAVGWGGAVELWDNEVKECLHTFEPVANRCVIFTTSDYSWHGVTAVKSPDGTSRNSFAAYYYSKDAGENAGEVWGGDS